MKHLVLLLVLLASCQSAEPVSTTDEITKTETQFMQACRDSGISKAFYIFADEKAVIKREHDTLILGRDAILQYYTQPFYNTAQVEWKPDHVEIAQSGDLAYSYGNYKWIFSDSTGVKSEYTGVYMTIWKKQKVHTWKYVWD